MCYYVTVVITLSIDITEENITKYQTPVIGTLPWQLHNKYTVRMQFYEKNDVSHVTKNTVDVKMCLKVRIGQHD